MAAKWRMRGGTAVYSAGDYSGPTRGGSTLPTGGLGDGEKQIQSRAIWGRNLKDLEVHQV